MKRTGLIAIIVIGVLAVIVSGWMIIRKETVFKKNPVSISITLKQDAGSDNPETTQLVFEDDKTEMNELINLLENGIKPEVELFCATFLSGWELELEFSYRNNRYQKIVIKREDLEADDSHYVMFVDNSLMVLMIEQNVQQILGLIGLE